MITDSAVYSDEVVIQAPAELVWDILLDFDSYADWNAFCPTVKNDSLELGSAVDMMVDLGEGLARQVEYICRVEPHECIAWRMDNRPGDPIHAVRSQYIKRIDDASCTYLSVDEFSGPEVQPMMEALAASVEAGFNRCAYGLKDHAEKLYRSGSQ